MDELSFKHVGELTCEISTDNSEGDDTNASHNWSMLRLFDQKVEQHVVIFFPKKHSLNGLLIREMRDQVMDFLIYIGEHDKGHLFLPEDELRETFENDDLYEIETKVRIPFWFINITFIHNGYFFKSKELFKLSKMKMPKKFKSQERNMQDFSDWSQGITFDVYKKLIE